MSQRRRHRQHIHYPPNSPLLDRLCHVARSPDAELTITADEANVLLAWLTDDQSEDRR